MQHSLYRLRGCSFVSGLYSIRDVLLCFKTQNGEGWSQLFERKTWVFPKDVQKKPLTVVLLLGNRAKAQQWLFLGYLLPGIEWLSFRDSLWAFKFFCLLSRLQLLPPEYFQDRCCLWLLDSPRPSVTPHPLTPLLCLVGHLDLKTCFPEDREMNCCLSLLLIQMLKASKPVILPFFALSHRAGADQSAAVFPKLLHATLGDVLFFPE